jgi:glycosyltransferase involved in cell wall biosynthesis
MHVKRGRLLAVEGTEAHQIVAALAELDVRADVGGDVGPREHLALDTVVDAGHETKAIRWATGRARSGLSQPSAKFSGEIHLPQKSSIGAFILSANTSPTSRLGQAEPGVYLLNSSSETGAGTPRFTLIVPAHNESARIGKTIVEYLDAFEDSEVLLVLNGCTDDTEAIAYRAALGRPNLRLLHIDHAVGKGGAVRAGFLAARAPVVGYVDADGATSGAEMRRLFELVRPGVDGVIASRWSSGARIEVAQPLLRRIAGRCFNAIVRVLFGLPYTDTQCGAKVFSGEAIGEIAPRLEVSNFAFDIDVLYALRRAGRTVIEVPTVWNDVGGSKLRVADASRSMLKAILRLRIRHSIFRYVIPIFDRFWPTSPLRLCDGLSILILNAYDPKHPKAGAQEIYLHEVARRLVVAGHRVHWLCGRAAALTENDEVDGISISRVGNGLTVHAAVPIAYARRFRDTFDIVIDAADTIPFLSPLFSLKPKICLVSASDSTSLGRIPIQLRNFTHRFRLSIVRWLYENSRVVTHSTRVIQDLKHFEIEADLVDPAAGWDSVTAVFLEIVFDELVRTHTRYIRSGESDWSVVHSVSARSKSTAMRSEFEISTHQ